MIVHECTIASGASTSSAIELGRTNPIRTPLKVFIPAAGWTAAAISFEVSLDGTAWFTLRDTNGVIASPSLAAADCFSIPPGLFLGIPFIRIRSGVPGTFVNQAAARTVQLVSAVL